MPDKFNLVDRAMEALESDEDLGFCTACGNEQRAEQDARRYECEACGKRTVNGAMVIVGRA